MSRRCAMVGGTSSSQTPKNPLRLLIELLWTKMGDRFGDMFPGDDDLDLERLAPFLDACGARATTWLGLGVPEIIEEGVNDLAWVDRAQRVGPALVQQPEVCCPNLRGEQRVVQSTLRLIDVAVGRHHVEVAGEHHRSP